MLVFLYVFVDFACSLILAQSTCFVLPLFRCYAQPLFSSCDVGDLWTMPEFCGGHKIGRSGRLARRFGPQTSSRKATSLTSMAFRSASSRSVWRSVCWDGGRAVKRGMRSPTRSGLCLKPRHYLIARKVGETHWYGVALF